MSFRRLRIVCVSDTHNQTPHLPLGDILIHAGDLCQQGTPDELRKVIKWLEATNFKLKIVVAGNHDACLDPKSILRGRNTDAHARSAVSELLRASPTIEYFEHETKILRLENEDGTEVKLKVFGSPYAPGPRCRAFGYSPEETSATWSAIPLDADIVVAHTPAKYHLDESPTAGAVGCPQLREALWRVRPKLFVCGHIHEGRGVEIVEWDLDSPNVKYKESGVKTVPEPTTSSKTLFRVDVSSRSPFPLRNDASRGDLVPCSRRGKARGAEVTDSSSVGTEPGACTRGNGGPVAGPCTDQEAVLGREGRRQTLVVNASYLSATTLTRSHRLGQGVNAPVLLDMDFGSDPGPEEWYATAVLLSLNDHAIDADSDPRSTGFV